MKKLILVLLLLIAGTGAVWQFKKRTTPAPLVLSGSIEARDAEIGSLVGGRVSAVSVEEGDTVKSGQVVATLQSDLLDLQIQEQQQHVEQAQANLTKLKRGPRSEELKRAKLDWENTDRESKRLQSLFEQGIIGRQQYDAAATRASLALESYKELQTGNRAEDIQAGKAAVDQEETRLAYL